jgi:hypothetical protein
MRHDLDARPDHGAADFVIHKRLAHGWDQMEDHPPLQARIAKSGADGERFVEGHLRTAEDDGGGGDGSGALGPNGTEISVSNSVCLNRIAVKHGIEAGRFWR